MSQLSMAFVRIQSIARPLWRKTNIFHSLPRCTSTTTISLVWTISPSCQFSLGFNLCELRISYLTFAFYMGVLVNINRCLLWQPACHVLVENTSISQHFLDELVRKQHV